MPNVNIEFVTLYFTRRDRREYAMIAVVQLLAYDWRPS